MRRGSPYRSDPVVGRILGHHDQLAHAVVGQLAGFGDDLFQRLAGMFAAHLGDGAEGAQAVTAFGDLQVREVARRDAQAAAIGQCANRGRAKDRALFGEVSHQPIRHLGDVLATKDADQRVDLGPFGQQGFLLPLGQASRDNHAVRLPGAFELATSSSIAAYDSVRACSMNPHVFTTTKSVPSGSATSS